MDSVIQSVRQKFPSVQQLATDELASWLADSTRPAPFLVDGRSAGEFSVSHLRDAANLTTVSEVKSVVLPSRPVVVYCSVGYRSSALAQKLQKAGFAHVYNLEGSIFKWANEGHPVFRGTSEVEEVHPYNATWGKLLDQRLHSKQKTF
jgi:rhodanese-related sulfurtransferase